MSERTRGCSPYPKTLNKSTIAQPIKTILRVKASKEEAEKAEPAPADQSGSQPSTTLTGTGTGKKKQARPKSDEEPGTSRSKASGEGRGSGKGRGKSNASGRTGYDGSGSTVPRGEAPSDSSKGRPTDRQKDGALQGKSEQIGSLSEEDLIDMLKKLLSRVPSVVRIEARIKLIGQVLEALLLVKGMHWDLVSQIVTECNDALDINQRREKVQRWARDVEQNGEENVDFHGERAGDPFCFLLVRDWQETSRPGKGDRGDSAARSEAALSEAAPSASDGEGDSAARSEAEAAPPESKADGGGNLTAPRRADEMMEVDKACFSIKDSPLYNADYLPGNNKRFPGHPVANLDIRVKRFHIRGTQKQGLFMLVCNKEDASGKWSPAKRPFPWCWDYFNGERQRSRIKSVDHKLWEPSKQGLGQCLGESYAPLIICECEYCQNKKVHLVACTDVEVEECFQSDSRAAAEALHAEGVQERMQKCYSELEERKVEGDGLCFERSVLEGCEASIMRSNGQAAQEDLQHRIFAALERGYRNIGKKPDGDHDAIALRNGVLALDSIKDSEAVLSKRETNQWAAHVKLPQKGQVAAYSEEDHMALMIQQLRIIAVIWVFIPGNEGATVERIMLPGGDQLNWTAPDQHDQFCQILQSDAMGGCSIIHLQFSNGIQTADNREWDMDHPGNHFDALLPISKPTGNRNWDHEFLEYVRSMPPQGGVGAAATVQGHVLDPSRSLRDSLQYWSPGVASDAVKISPDEMNHFDELQRKVPRPTRCQTNKFAHVEHVFVPQLGMLFGSIVEYGAVMSNEEPRIRIQVLFKHLRGNDRVLTKLPIEYFVSHCPATTLPHDPFQLGHNAGEKRRAPHSDDPGSSKRQKTGEACRPPCARKRPESPGSTPPKGGSGNDGASPGKKSKPSDDAYMGRWVLRQLQGVLTCGRVTRKNGDLWCVTYPDTSEELTEEELKLALEARETTLLPMRELSGPTSPAPKITTVVTLPLLLLG